MDTKYCITHPQLPLATLVLTFLRLWHLNYVAGMICSADPGTILIIQLQEQHKHGEIQYVILAPWELNHKPKCKAKGKSKKKKLLTLSNWQMASFMLLGQSLFNHLSSRKKMIHVANNCRCPLIKTATSWLPACYTSRGNILVARSIKTRLTLFPNRQQYNEIKALFRCFYIAASALFFLHTWTEWPKSNNGKLVLTEIWILLS